MTGRLLCRVGLHRWQYEQNYTRRRLPSGQWQEFEVVSCRCRRGCAPAGVWAVVNVEPVIRAVDRRVRRF